MKLINPNDYTIEAADFIGFPSTRRKSGREFLVGLLSVVILYGIEAISSANIVDGPWAPVLPLLVPAFMYAYRVLRGSALFPLGEEPTA